MPIITVMIIPLESEEKNLQYYVIQYYLIKIIDGRGLRFHIFKVVYKLLISCRVCNLTQVRHKSQKISYKIWDRYLL